MSTMSNKQRLLAFAPAVYLHSEEAHFPCTVTAFIGWCRLEFRDEATSNELPWVVEMNPLVSEHVTKDNVNRQQYYSYYQTRQFYSSYDRSDGQTTPFFLSLKSEAHRGGENIAQVPFYGAAFEASSHWDLLYGFFYAYNGKAMNDPGWFTHDGDWEHVVVRVSKEDKLLGAYYQAHRSSDEYSRWYYPPPPTGQKGAAEDKYFEWEEEGRRVRVYSSKEGHGSYAKAGSWDYGTFRGTDVTDKGRKWDPAKNVDNTKNIIEMDGTEGWNDFNGNFGANGGPHSPLVQGWLKVNAPSGGPCVGTSVEVVKDKDLYGERYSENFKLPYPADALWRVSSTELTPAQIDQLRFDVYEDISWGFDDPVLEDVENGDTTKGAFDAKKLYIGRVRYGGASGDDVFKQLGIRSFTIVAYPI